MYVSNKTHSRLELFVRIQPWVYFIRVHLAIDLDARKQYTH